jgi:hypothetical protein
VRSLTEGLHPLMMPAAQRHRNVLSGGGTWTSMYALFTQVRARGILVTLSIGGPLKVHAASN